MNDSLGVSRWSFHFLPARMIYSTAGLPMAVARCAGDVSVVVHVHGATHVFNGLHRALLVMRCQYFERIADPSSASWALTLDHMALERGDIETFWTLVYLIDATKWLAFWHQASATLLPLSDLRRFLRIRALALYLGFDAVAAPIQELVLRTTPRHMALSRHDREHVAHRCEQLIHLARLCYETPQPGAEEWAVRVLVWASAFVVTPDFRATWSHLVCRDMGELFDDPASVLAIAPDAVPLALCTHCIHSGAVHRTYSQTAYSVNISQTDFFKTVVCLFRVASAPDGARIQLPLETYDSDAGLQQCTLRDTARRPYVSHNAYAMPDALFEKGAETLCAGHCSICDRQNVPSYVFFLPK